MGTRTVHTLAYKLLIDSDQFTKGTVASRKEIAMAKREMRSMLTPAEKMEHSLEKLGQLAKKDARFQELYNRKLQQYNETLSRNAKATSRFTESSDGLKTRLTGIATALTALGGTAVFGAIRVAQREIDRIDDLAKASDRLGISTEKLTQIQFAANKFSGFAPEKTTSAIEKMVRRISEAAQGTGEAKAVIEELGLSAQTLASLSPDKALERIADSLRKVKSESDLLRISTKLFDDEQAGLFMTLTQSNSALQAQFDRADQLGATVSSFDASNIAHVKDSVTEMEAAFAAFSTKFTTNLAPSLVSVLNELTRLLSDMQPLRNGPSNSVAGDYLAAGIRTMSENYKNYSNFVNETIHTGSLLMQGQGKLSDFGRISSATGRMARGGPGSFFRHLDAIEAEQAKRMRSTPEKSNISPDSSLGDTGKAQVESAKTDTLRNRRMREALDLTRSVMTAEERRTVAIQKANQLLEEGLINEQTKQRLIDQADNRLKQSIMQQSREQGSDSLVNQTSLAVGFDGPMQSLAAGSSEEFRLLNRTSAIKSVSERVAIDHLEVGKQTLEELKRITDARFEGPQPHGLEV